MDKGTTAILWSLFILVLFVFLTLSEVWFLKHLGFDILAHLQVSLKQGKTKKFFFEAFGVVAFVVAQPFGFLLLFGQIWEQVREAVQKNLDQLFGG